MERQSFLRRYPEVPFVILAYVLAFLVMLLVFVDAPFEPLLILGSWTPNIAAFLVLRFVLREEGEVRQLVAGWGKWRVGVRWYLMALSPLFIALLAAAVFVALGGTPTEPEQPIGLPLLMSFLLSAVTGATGEELGWRGFALPRLQERFSSLVSAVILGLVVSGWHGLLHLASPTGLPEWQFWIALVSYSVIVTWAYNRSTGSILIATIFHFSFNFSLELVSTGLALVPLEILFGIETAIYAGIAAILIATTGKNLSKVKAP